MAAYFSHAVRSMASRCVSLRPVQSQTTPHTPVTFNPHPFAPATRHPEGSAGVLRPEKKEGCGRTGRGRPALAAPVSCSSHPPHPTPHNLSTTAGRVLSPREGVRYAQAGYARAVEVPRRTGLRCLARARLHGRSVRETIRFAVRGVTAREPTFHSRRACGIFIFNILPRGADRPARQPSRSEKRKAPSLN
jgi:hypothetical protein